MTTKIEPIVKELRVMNNYIVIVPLILKMSSADDRFICFRRGTDLGVDEVIDYINEMDDDDWDIELLRKC